MKWTNKGHEFDEIGVRISSFSKIAIFCAGTKGIELLNIVHAHTNLEVVAFIDNDSEKQGSIIDGISVFSALDWFRIQKNDTAVVITVHNRDLQNVIIRQLEDDYDLKYNYDVFITHKFIPIYMWYKNKKLIAFNTIYSITQFCNLKCKNCNSFMQYIQNPKHMGEDKVKNDIDLLFSTFDYMFILNLFGGETTLHPDLPEIIRYIHTNYESRYDFLGIATNGFTKLSSELVDAIKATNAVINISNYAQYFPNDNERQRQFATFVQCLKDNNITHHIEDFSSYWFDYGFETVDRTTASEEILQAVFNKCNMHCRLMQDGKYYNCAYDKLALNIGVHSQDSGFDLQNFDSKDKVSLLEYNLGYSTKGYVELCKICDGSGSQTRVTPAIQTEKAIP